jgi:hypothetical protein
MEMSNPRTSYHETLNWVRGFCGTFCILPAWLWLIQLGKNSNKRHSLKH